ncbi:MAG: glycosyltransferase family 4 protein [Synechococcales cyanobacterium RM1_1_8]|nr:glycosyltransferase family 4 protein [Synechococcales cyanobacterium RM1_1_8]
MKVLVLAWEFPPRIVGGIARHIAELYPEMVLLDQDIHLLTVSQDAQAHRDQVDGIQVHRLPVTPGNDFLHWVANMNEIMGQYGGELLLREGPFDLIHAHDWLVGDAAIALQHHFNLPLLTTIHATEQGRHGGLHNYTNHYINDKERALVQQSCRVIVCTEYMRREVTRIHRYPDRLIDVIYNGIRPEKKLLAPSFDRQLFRRKFALDDEKIFYYVGRITYEKGISVLLNAAHRVFERLEGNAKLVVIGGGNTEALQRQARMLGIGQHCMFTGFMDEEDLDRFQAIADCAVFPSLYEPFGIVALESFAARVPVVVSDAGGLPEVVSHGKTGLVTQRGNSDSLAQGILDVLEGRVDTHRLVQRAYAGLEQHFSWPKLAKQTLASYSQLSVYQRQTVAAS